MSKRGQKYYKNLFREVIKWRSMGLKEDEARNLCLSQGKSILGVHFNSQTVSQTFEKAWTSPRKDFRLTDVGNAERLVSQHGGDIRYCYPWKSWLIWRGRRWEIDDSGGMDRRSEKTVKGIYAEASLSNDGHLRKVLADWAK